MEERKREWRIVSSSFYELSLQVKFSHFVHISLGRTRPHSDPHLSGRVGDVVSWCPERKRLGFDLLEISP